MPGFGARKVGAGGTALTKVYLISHKVQQAHLASLTG